MGALGADECGADGVVEWWWVQMGCKVVVVQMEWWWVQMQMEWWWVQMEWQWVQMKWWWGAKLACGHIGATHYASSQVQCPTDVPGFVFSFL